ncbi:MAG: hypothetical protein AOY29_12665 [Alcanivorax borkumensis]|uniref:Uncharacterized protein n=1 Tax=Alcanivorax borkumensis (strain ATCC 700651 / DSM 11573 / NCIMB 13689 / SK2) TaxID=393595 RepID=Q0VLV8_ALCBS|nr:DUF523 domain-containing protein [Alcanivorax borkumensis]OJH07804.1 MAG: hypothetical protein AOY29_12665 [Alcanivorax borkumensis]CAL17840.1 conserved hypothetical protein [Alcanivorax borkumensis SK2]
MLTDLLEKMGFDLPQQEWQKPIIGVSACLTGQKVRYDGDHKHNAIVIHQLAPWLRFRETCPEVAIGLPVPRPPIQVVQLEGRLRVRGVDQPQQDVTDALENVAATLQQPLSGFVLKARSPSCGYLNTPVHNPQGQQIGIASGAFANKLHQHFPRIALANEEDMEKPACLQAFVLQAYCYHQWRHNDQQGQWLHHMQQQTEQLDEPLRNDMRQYLEQLGQAMH